MKENITKRTITLLSSLPLQLLLLLLLLILLLLLLLLLLFLILSEQKYYFNSFFLHNASLNQEKLRVWCFQRVQKETSSMKCVEAVMNLWKPF